MQFLIRRSQYEDWSGTIYYVLDTIVEPTPDEKEIIDTHDVGSIVVFASEQHKERMEAAQQHGTKAADTLSSAPLVHQGSTEDMFFGFLSGVGSAFYSLGGAAYNLILGSFGTVITVQSLLDGAHIESDNHQDVLQAEQIIRDAIEGLQATIKNLQSFDGQEELYEPE